MSKEERNKKIADKARERWKGLTDEQYWERVDKIRAGVQKHWDTLSPEERAKRTAHLEAARAKRDVDHKESVK